MPPVKPAASGVCHAIGRERYAYPVLHSRKMAVDRGSGNRIWGPRVRRGSVADGMVRGPDMRCLRVSAGKVKWALVSSLNLLATGRGGDGDMGQSRIGLLLWSASTFPNGHGIAISWLSA
jgi:hypothetical protein